MKWRRSDRLLDQAARWVVLIDSAEFDAAAAARFQKWISRSQDHRAVFLHTSKTWGDLDVLAKLKAYPVIAAFLEADPKTQRTAPREPQFLRGRRALLLGGGVVAAGACIIGYNPLALGPAEAFETRVGEQRAVTLVDGTQVFLNAGTRLEARLSTRRREVRLVSGEALFVIAPDADAPFLVVTSRGAVEAASGEILVKLLPAGVRVGLMSQAAHMARRSLIGRDEPVAVEAHNEIVFNDAGMAIAAAPAEQLSRRVLWRQGMLAFEDTPLAEAAADVARQTGMRFTFADPALAELRVGGLIQRDDLQAFLQLLRENLAINAERRGDEILLSSTATL